MSSRSALTTLTRAERTGSIFGRITGLIRAGTMKWEDRPLWYDAYAAHPPLQEPIWDIKMPKHSQPVPKIFYQEDIERAKKQFSSSRDGEEPKYNLDEPLTFEKAEN